MWGQLRRTLAFLLGDTYAVYVPIGEHPALAVLESDWTDWDFFLLGKFSLLQRRGGVGCHMLLPASHMIPCNYLWLTHSAHSHCSTTQDLVQKCWLVDINQGWVFMLELSKNCSHLRAQTQQNQHTGYTGVPEQKCHPWIVVLIKQIIVNGHSASQGHRWEHPESNKHCLS